MNQSKVLVVGNNTIDLVFVSECIPRTGEKCQAKEFRCIAGGQAANTAVALRGLSVSVEYAGCFGDDQYGHMSKQSLLDCGIRLTHSVTRTQCPQHLASIVVSTLDNERTITMYKDPRIVADDLEPDAKWLEDVSVVYTDGHERSLSIKLAILAREKGIPMLGDAEDAEQARALLEFLSSLIAPEEVVLELAGTPDIRQALHDIAAVGPAIVIATKGKDGSVGYASSVGFVEIPAHPCLVRDTTGAGDAFHAGYIAAGLAGANMETAMLHAARVASVACECLGPRVDFTLLEKRGVVVSNRTLKLPQRGVWI